MRQEVSAVGEKEERMIESIRHKEREKGDWVNKQRPAIRWEAIEQAIQNMYAYCHIKQQNVEKGKYNTDNGVRVIIYTKTIIVTDIKQLVLCNQTN